MESSNLVQVSKKLSFQFYHDICEFCTSAMTTQDCKAVELLAASYPIISPVMFCKYRCVGLYLDNTVWGFYAFQSWPACIKYLPDPRKGANIMGSYSSGFQPDLECSTWTDPPPPPPPMIQSPLYTHPHELIWCLSIWLGKKRVNQGSSKPKEQASATQAKSVP